MMHVLELAIPLPGTPLAFLGGLLIGYGIGWALHADDNEGDSGMAPMAPSWRHVYEKVAPLLVVFCLVVSCLASVGVYVTNNVNRRQDRDADASRAALIRCLDDFTSSLGAGLPPVRKATTARDSALSAALGKPDGLQELVAKISRRRATPADLRRLASVLRAYHDADDQLDRTRRAHPYPPAPSKACPALSKGNR